MRWILAALLLQSVFGAKILQLTDFHYDMDYAPTWPNGTKRGVYGDYCCDAPAKLVKLAIEKANEALPNPDYLFWTGDNVPHIENYNESYVINAIGYTTTWINSFFEGIQVIPTFGNHDYAPSNAFPDQNNQIYSKTYTLWKHWIGDSAKETFLKGGYYKLTGVNNETFLVLNTNLYYQFNKAKFLDKDDPAGQFAFMEANLEEAKTNNKTIHVIAHIAPGAFERTPKFTWMVPAYNKRFLDITIKYASTIKWMIFGHHHTDTFHVVKDDKMQPVQLMLMAPAVTPWFSDLDHAGSNNPAFRIFDYEPQTWAMNDVLTYYIDLDKLNQKGDTAWQLEYSFREDYGISSEINAASMNALLESMKKNETVFNKYLKYNSVLWKPETAEGIYRRAQLCSIEFPDFPRYNDCLNSASTYNLFTAFLVVMGIAMAL
ncbi:hypothetical protein QR680_004551 [Steinernema hermaphroditum]|uniref:Calcineurin-like phosphoesterase domain-containing protein n=1 Tax=Steinernema hermaphroditum TaxID=289476 RepID=A0AA39HP31_9BILA|nr:hypothetical protein QR680_004551 [Steinernema hermaphroditum]